MHVGTARLSCAEDLGDVGTLLVGGVIFGNLGSSCSIFSIKDLSDIRRPVDKRSVVVFVDCLSLLSAIG